VRKRERKRKEKGMGSDLRVYDRTLIRFWELRKLVTLIYDFDDTLLNNLQRFSIKLDSTPIISLLLSISSYSKRTLE